MRQALEQCLLPEFQSVQRIYTESAAVQSVDVREFLRDFHILCYHASYTAGDEFGIRVDVVAVTMTLKACKRLLGSFICSKLLPVSTRPKITSRGELTNPNGRFGHDFDHIKSVS